MSDNLDRSGTRFAVEYHLSGREAEARAKAEALCLDQTVELPDELIPEGPIRNHILGRVESFCRIEENRYEAVISFACELVDNSSTQLLNVMFGIASLKPGIRVTRFRLPDVMVQAWPGPRVGRAGLRERVGVHHRPLVCGVLKPVGLTPAELGDLAYRFALGGLDLIKDDQGLADQTFCPFDERVARCCEAVDKANRETGRTCLYFPNVTGTWEATYSRCVRAKRAGVGGILICPGLAGFGTIQALAADGQINLPIMSHPAFLGSFIVHPESGIAPSVVFGQVPRLAGTDISIYPTYEGSFPMSQEDCRQIASETAVPWGHLKPIFPTAAGRIGLGRVREECDLYQGEMVMIVGTEVIRPDGDVVGACKTFMDEVSRCTQT